MLIYCLFNNTFQLCRLCNELETAYAKGVVVYFKLLSQHSLAETENSTKCLNRIAGVLTETRTWYAPDKKQKC
jgi:hypothetical protein